MNNSRALVFSSLIFLGSCVPLTPIQQPPPNIIVTVVSGEKPLATVQTTEKTACDLLIVDLREYELPPVPDLSHIDEDDEKAVTDALLAHIALLRDELREITSTCRK